MLRCLSCAHECADNSRFCASCATRLDATSAETGEIGVTSQSIVDEGRFLPGTVVAGRYRIAGLLAAAAWARSIAPPTSHSARPSR